jgi:hypothetical protein
VKRPLRGRFEKMNRLQIYSGYGWIGLACEFLCNRQNHARRDRRVLFSIHTKYGLLDRRPKKFSFD